MWYNSSRSFVSLYFLFFINLVASTCTAETNPLNRVWSKWAAKLSLKRLNTVAYSRLNSNPIHWLNWKRPVSSHPSTFFFGEQTGQKPISSKYSWVYKPLYVYVQVYIFVDKNSLTFWRVQHVNKGNNWYHRTQVV